MLQGTKIPPETKLPHARAQPHLRGRRGHQAPRQNAQEHRKHFLLPCPSKGTLERSGDLEQDSSARICLQSSTAGRQTLLQHFSCWVLSRESCVSPRVNQAEQSWELAQELQ